jgi:hypothetical protein
MRALSVLNLRRTRKSSDEATHIAKPGYPSSRQCLGPATGTGLIPDMWMDVTPLGCFSVVGDLDLVMLARVKCWVGVERGTAACLQAQIPDAAEGERWRPTANRRATI